MDLLFEKFGTISYRWSHSHAFEKFDVVLKLCLVLGVFLNFFSEHLDKGDEHSGGGAEYALTFI